MEVEVWVKVAAIIAALVALPKVFRESQGLVQRQRKDSFDLAKELVEAARANRHPFEIEACFSALYRKALTAPEIAYLLKSATPSRAIRLYLAGRFFLRYEHSSSGLGPAITYQRIAESAQRRRIAKAAYQIVYVAAATAACWVVIETSAGFRDAAMAWFVFVAPVVAAFGAAAFVALVAHFAVDSAEAFMRLRESESGPRQIPTLPRT